MQMSDLAPANQFAQQFGVKAVVYGGPGGGKTPICVTTSPRPVALMCEPGFLSLRGSNVPTFPAFNPPRIAEFFQWFMNSNESKNFDTLVVDSISQAAEIHIDAQTGQKSKGGEKKHGQQIYGEMAEVMMKYINDLYFMQAKHIILIAKQEIIDLNGMQYKRPYFPGKVLPVRVPHLFDVITNLSNHLVPGVNGPTKAFRTREDFGQMGRDRSGRLNEFEPPNMGQLIDKCMS